MKNSDSFTGNARFQVLSLLGTGGMGVVYEALDRERNVTVAIKTLRIQGASRLLRFKQEFRALRDIRHPNLVELGELFEEDGVWFFTMERVKGVNIRKYVRVKRPDDDDNDAVEMVFPTTIDGPSLLGATTDIEPWPSDRLPGSAGQLADPRDLLYDSELADEAMPAEVVPASHLFDEGRLRSALKGLGAGIAALHRAGKVHCDIKPPNIMVDDDGRVVVLDFGVVTELRAASYSVPHIIVGSPAYMAPEQAGGGEVGPAADWYGVGVILFEMLTGRLPFQADTAGDLVTIKLHAPAPHPAEFASELPDDLVSLCIRLLANKAEDRPGEDEVLDLLGVEEDRIRISSSDLRVVRAPMFVGRRAELDQLRQAYEASREGRSVSVFIEGESGVGKSATVEQFIETLAGEPNAVILRGQCHEREFVPYNAFDGVVDDLGRYLRARYRGARLSFVPDGVGDLLDVFPILRGVRGLARHADEERTLGDARSRAFFALRELLAWVAKEAILAIVIHDIHWADADSLTLLGELMNDKSELALLFLATARKRDDGSSCPGRYAVRGDVRQIELAGLDPAEAEELALRLFERLGGGFAGDASALVAETQGHPLFMVELVRHMSARAEPDGSVNLYEGELDDALRSRVAMLGAQAKDLLETVAIAGAPIARSVLARAVELSPGELASRLTELRDAMLIRISGASRRETVAPYHDRVREAIADDLASERRRALHGKVARALEASDAPSIRLAVHYFHAGELASSAVHAITAARQAVEVFAFDQAAELYSMAIVAGKHGNDDQRQLLTEMGMALQNAGRPKEAAEAYLAAAEWTAPADRLELRRRAAEQLLTGGHMDEGVEVLTDVLRQANLAFARDSRRAYMLAAWNLARLRLRRLSWRTRKEHEIAPELLSEQDVCWTVGSGFALVDSVHAMVFALRGARIALECGEPFRIARSMCMSSLSSSALGDAKGGKRLLEASERASAEHGSALARVYTEIAQFGYTFFFEQRWRRCVEHRHEIERLWHSSGKGGGFELTFVIQFSTWSLDMLGDPRATTLEVKRVLRDAQRVGDRLLEVSMRVYHSMVHLAADDPDTGARDIADAIGSWLPGRDVFQLPHAWALCSQGNIALYRGEPRMPGELSMRFHRLRRSPLWNTIWTRSNGQYLQGRLALARAALAAESGGGTELRKWLELAKRMAQKLEKYRSPVQPLLGSLIRAGIARIRRNDRAAVKHLHRAIAGLEGHETALHAQAARMRLGETIGGSEGEALLGEARHWMCSHGIARPSRIARMLVPGW